MELVPTPSSTNPSSYSTSIEDIRIVPAVAPQTPPPAAAVAAAVTSISTGTPIITPQNPFDQIASSSSSLIPSPSSAIAPSLLNPSPRAPSASMTHSVLATTTTAALSPATATATSIATTTATPPQQHSSITEAALSEFLSSPPAHSDLQTVYLHSSTNTTPQQQQHRQLQATANTGRSTAVLDDDDDITEPSSANNSQPPHHQHESGDEDNPAHPRHNLPVIRGAGSPMARFLESTRQKLSVRGGTDPHHNLHTQPQQVGVGLGGFPLDPLDEEGIPDSPNHQSGVLISGYLQKLGRNGKWQARWFETDGECLSYYKSAKRSKLLATLDLAKVGQIVTTDASSDSAGCSFSIQVLGRMYNLRADSRASCKDWVITLNRVKEARLNQGNTKLVHGSGGGGGGGVDGVGAAGGDHPPQSAPPQGMSAPRVVVVANRHRTRAVDDTPQDWEHLISPHDESVAVEATFDDGVGVGNTDLLEHEQRRSALGNVVLARWSKRRSTLNRFGAKLARWARGITKYRCTDVKPEDAVHLDRHVHPPGHDDIKPKKSLQQSELPRLTTKTPQPSRLTRAFSITSDEDGRYLS